VRVSNPDARDEMVRQLRRLGIRDARVLDAMAHVPREEFVRASDREVAYGDHALPIGEGQTISQPYIVARMTELLDVRSTDRVLEVGTGSGYQAAVLGQLAADVVSVERHASLAQAARELLARSGYRNVRVVHDDASLGHPAKAPYDRILITAATPQIDPALAAQLTPAGRIVAPVGDEEMQELVVRHANGREERHGAVRFVPLRGEAGFRS
jgi:protein-L-isoaspartate(D-aspartate) O-methyltransferase